MTTINEPDPQAAGILLQAIFDWLLSQESQETVSMLEAGELDTDQVEVS